MIEDKGSTSGKSQDEGHGFSRAVRYGLMRSLGPEVRFFSELGENMPMRISKVAAHDLRPGERGKHCGFETHRTGSTMSIIG
jgi:hypothetical protein